MPFGIDDNLYQQMLGGLQFSSLQGAGQGVSPMQPNQGMGGNMVPSALAGLPQPPTNLMSQLAMNARRGAPTNVPQQPVAPPTPSRHDLRQQQMGGRQQMGGVGGGGGGGFLGGLLRARMAGGGMSNFSPKGMLGSMMGGMRGGGGGMGGGVAPGPPGLSGNGFDFKPWIQQIEQDTLQRVYQQQQNAPSQQSGPYVPPALSQLPKPPAAMGVNPAKVPGLGGYTGGVPSPGLGGLPAFPASSTPSQSPRINTNMVPGIGTGSPVSPGLGGFAQPSQPSGGIERFSNNPGGVVPRPSGGGYNTGNIAPPVPLGGPYHTSDTTAPQFPGHAGDLTAPQFPGHAGDLTPPNWTPGMGGPVPSPGLGAGGTMPTTQTPTASRSGVPTIPNPRAGMPAPPTSSAPSQRPALPTPPWVTANQTINIPGWLMGQNPNLGRYADASGNINVGSLMAQAAGPIWGPKMQAAQGQQAQQAQPSAAMGAGAPAAAPSTVPGMGGPVPSPGLGGVPNVQNPAIPSIPQPNVPGPGVAPSTIPGVPTPGSVGQPGSPAVPNAGQMAQQPPVAPGVPGLNAGQVLQQGRLGQGGLPGSPAVPGRQNPGSQIPGAGQGAGAVPPGGSPAGPGPSAAPSQGSGSVGDPSGVTPGSGLGAGINWSQLNQWDPQINDAVSMFPGAPADMLKAMMAVESGGDPNAQGAGGAVGLMQVKPSIWQPVANNLGIGDLNDPGNQLKMAAAILAGAPGTGGTPGDPMGNFLSIYYPIPGGGTGESGNTQGQYEQALNTLIPAIDSATGGPLPKTSIPGSPTSQGKAGGVPQDPAAPSTPDQTGTNDPAGNQLVDIAKQYVGVQYSWGSIPGKNDDPRQTGWDCSGMVYWLAEQQGLDAGSKQGGVPMGSHYQYQWAQQTGRLISDPSQLQPGDIVFFDTTEGRTQNIDGGGAELNNASHVGMYIGNGQFIEAANPNDGTIIANLSDPYYAQRFMGGASMM